MSNAFLNDGYLFHFLKGFLLARMMVDYSIIITSVCMAALRIFFNHTKLLFRSFNSDFGKGAFFAIIVNLAM